MNVLDELLLAVCALINGVLKTLGLIMLVALVAWGVADFIATLWREGPGLLLHPFPFVVFLLIFGPAAVVVLCIFHRGFRRRFLRFR